MMKRFISFILTAVMLFSVSACGSAPASSETDEPRHSEDKDNGREPNRGNFFEDIGLGAFGASGSAGTAASSSPSEDRGSPAADSSAPSEDHGPADSSASAEATECYAPVPLYENPTVVPVWDTVYADLDGDGWEDEIYVEPGPGYYGEDSYRIYINGYDYTDEIVGDYYIDCPDDYYYAVMDIDENDGVLELALQDWGPSDDYYTHFLRFDGNELRVIGGVPGMIYPYWGEPDISLLGGGNVSTDCFRLGVLHTWWAWTDYYYDEYLDKMVESTQDIYYSTYSTNVTVLTDICGYDGINGSACVIGAGSVLNIWGTDNSEWVYCTDVATGDCILLHLVSEYELETPEGSAYPWYALDGLCMAD